MTSARLRDAALVALFFLSGASGLVYEVVWLRMLIRAFGVTVYAVSTVLVLYMTGLAAGSILCGKWLSKRSSPLRLYGAVEIAIGASSWVSSALMSVLPSVVQSRFGAWSGAEIVVVRFLLSLIVLLPPTLFMGATLPLVTGTLVATKEGVARSVGLLYGANTLGAVAGVLAAGFFMLASLGEHLTIVWATAGNITVGVLALYLSRFASAPTRPEVAEPESAPRSAHKVRWLLVAYGASGYCALSYQVIWSRMSALILGNSVYGFSLMLGAYLAGIGLGSMAIARRAEKMKRPLFVFGVLEVMVAILALVSLLAYTQIGLSDKDPAHTYSQIASAKDFLRLGVDSVLLVLPVTLVLGAMFPVVNRVAAERSATAEESVGASYGANTIGAIVGSFLTGFVLLSVLGTLKSFLVASAMSLIIGLCLLWASGREEQLSRWSRWVLGSALAFVLLLSFSFRDPFYAVLRARMPPALETLAHEEDENATVTLASDGRQSSIFINGIHVSDTAENIGEVMVGMPLSFVPQPKRALVIGLGVGEAFRAALEFGQDTTVVELQPIVVDLFRRFSPDAERFLKDPRGHVVVGDGRNFLLASKKTFDFVFVDGTPPVFASGMVNLYSHEFFALVRGHLSAGGAFALWFPTVCFEDDYWMIAHNFVDVFDDVIAWSYPGQAGVLMVGSPSKDRPFSAPESMLQERLAALGRKNRFLDRVSIRDMILFDRDFIVERSRGYPIVTDDRPYTEFPLFLFLSGAPYYADSRFILKQAKEWRASKATPLQ
jgi:spermidine synthase